MMNPILAINDLSVCFDTDDGVVHAVDNVSLSMESGEALGLVGESGCGKSVTAMSILRLIPTPPGRITNGAVTFRDDDLISTPTDALQKIRGRSIGMIFQEPMTALSPLHTVSRQMVETMRLHDKVKRSEALRIVRDWLVRVGIPDPDVCMGALPHQLSGGMRQRIMIAMALMLKPALLIADEPTTALDVTVQAQIFDLIRRMKEDDTAVLLITHDMGVIWEMCNRVAVMYAGQIVEEGMVREIFEDPLHPYTQALLASIPSTAGTTSRLPAIEGQVPSPLCFPKGCRFRDRCRYASARCGRELPDLYTHDGRKARCFLAEENP